VLCRLLRSVELETAIEIGGGRMNGVEVEVAGCWDDPIGRELFIVIVQVGYDYHRTCAKISILNLEYG